MVDRVNTYISCTNKEFDLKWTALEGIIQAGMYPVAWEFTSATSETSFDVIQKMINDSEIFIGIYALWYGGLTEGQETSWIEFEYDYALSQNKKMLIFVLSDTKTSTWPAEMVSTDEAATKLEKFKQKLKRNHRISFFLERDHLYSLIVQVLRTPPYSQIGAGRIVVEPAFGLPKKESQFDTNAFMIMPFSSEMQPIYENCIKPLVESLNLTIKRADNLFSTQSIMNDIWSIANAAKFIIADCTGKNPNVFYELGIAHTLGKPAIILTQNPEDVPFDLRHLRYIPYISTADGLKKLESDLQNAINKVLNPPEVPSPKNEPRWKRPTYYISLSDEF